MILDPSTVRSLPHTQIRISTHDLALLLYLAQTALNIASQPSGDHILTTVRSLQRSPHLTRLLPEASCLLCEHAAKLERFTRHESSLII